MTRQNKTRSLDDRIQALKRKLEKKTWWWLVSISYCCWLAAGPSVLFSRHSKQAAD
jgi:hypothetical protein